MSHARKLFIRSVFAGALIYFGIPLFIDLVGVLGSTRTMAHFVVLPLGIDVIGAGIAVLFVFNIKEMYGRFRFGSDNYRYPVWLMFLTALGFFSILCGMLFSDLLQEVVLGMGRELLSGLIIAVLALDLDLG